MTGRKKPKQNKTSKRSTSANLQKRPCNVKWSIRAAVAVCDMTQHPHSRPQKDHSSMFFLDLVSF